MGVRKPAGICPTGLGAWAGARPQLKKPPCSLLERNGHRDSNAGVHAIIEVVPIAGVVKIYIVGFVPSRRPRFRPRINKRHPIAVVLEARIPAYEEQRKPADAEEVVTPEVVPKAVIRNSVAAIAAALLPGAVIVIPRTRARLDETAAHLPLVLWNAAMVDAAIGGPAGLDAAMIGAAGALLRSLRRSVSWLLMLLCGLLLMLLCGLLLMLLALLLCGLLLVLLPLFRFALVLFVLCALCVGRSNGSEEQKQGPCADSEFHGHVSLLLKI